LARLGAILLATLVGCTPPSTTPAPSSRASATSSATAADARLEVVVEGLTAPVAFVPVPGSADLNLVVNQTGLIQVLDGGELEAEPFLDLRDRVIDLFPDYDERGLLAVAFHPDFGSNQRVFVYYAAPVRAQPEGGGPHDHTNTLSEFTVAADGRSADPATERILLQFEQPQFNHSGGGLGFGPDGFLYLGTGDGGGTGDDDEGHSPLGNAQDLARLSGKVLRLDVNGSDPYAIPPDNPFADGLAGARPEIYAYGFRNPWRLSWEPGGTHRLLVSDVGYGRYEEVDVVESGGNHGWRIREGGHCLDRDNPTTETEGCPTTGEDGEPLVVPAIEYTHADVGVAVVGGFVYRGSALPALAGQYLFADYSADRQSAAGLQIGGTLLVAEPQPEPHDWPWRPMILESGALSDYVTGLGEGADGEIYVLVRRQTGPTGQTGRVLRLSAPAE
jgi:glucose/arabinose dehydrogenase